MNTTPPARKPSAVSRSARSGAATTGLRWNGWYRSPSSRRWRILATSDDYETCLRELRDAAPNEGGVRELLVSPCHRNPNLPR